ncbi:helix-turn-helix domain-containing protein [Photobacterium damselae]|uniref:Helix-turn-helix domain-containing protein n=2 Tax=Photobacterium damselae TaxID=38293 RepID=A0A850R2P9_PHODD|nr:helix-turn-helix domain-containing protein [Photobacterium damselae subsp. damselae]MBE8127727.1 helix-turn-helix domain-containing protein [Photobacterium damselae subsp. piscicida]MCG3826265.1 helix-turn-helix domain-containing protein [Photobacterium damselae]NVP01331.1 helix-turn-helix domain-containing protein [Photobacterium damselae subsp. damselae]TLS87014.1 helix-turn-helix domain-containing protein [Photobacterium damselae subsp. damselae]
MAQRFSDNGSIDQLTMRKIDALAMSAKREEMTAARIQKLRQRERISQAVLATVLNMSSESVQKWEQGKTKPQGAALRLLNIIDEKGIAAVL